MGMFSWECPACNFSIRDCGGCCEDNWQGEGVVLTAGGSRIIGTYDGYGRIGGCELGEQIDDFAIYHKACWELKGKPEFTKPSRHAADQGFCITEHKGWKLPKPTSVEWFTQASEWLALGSFFHAVSGYLRDLEEAGIERAHAAFDEETRDRFEHKVLGFMTWGEDSSRTFEFDGEEFRVNVAHLVVCCARRDRGLEWPASPSQVNRDYFGDDENGCHVILSEMANGEFTVKVVTDDYPEETVAVMSGYADADVAWVAGTDRAARWCLAKGVKLGETEEGSARL
jgi:hypothetical protein